jgi:hypothetical protein
MEEKKYGVMIPRSEVLKLYESCLNEISAHSVGQWLKATTNNKYVVVPRDSVQSIYEWTNDIVIGATENALITEELSNNWL